MILDIFDEEEIVNLDKYGNIETKIFVWQQRKYVINFELYKQYYVLNLSDIEFSEYDYYLLSKGLGFSPTPRNLNLSEVQKDLNKFARKLRLRYFFHNLNKNQNMPRDSGNSQPSQPTNGDMQPHMQSHMDPLVKKIDKKFKPESNWSPSVGTNPHLETYIQCIKMDVDKTDFHKKKIKSNLSHKEWISFEKIKRKRDIVIKKADKGSAVVIMNRADYVKEAMSQLQDSKYYREVDHDETEKHSNIIKNYLLQLTNKGELSLANYAVLNPDNSREARFYFLPKIHKRVIKGRPIISGNGCPTEMISSFVDEHLKQFVFQLPSYVRDTTDFINKIEAMGTLPDGTLLVTMDVSSLYTNIPILEGLRAVSTFLRGHRTIGRLQSSSIIQLLKLVLTLNNFQFNGRHFLQVGGTAMGTKVAPTFANLFMGYLEKKILNEVDHTPQMFLRYIDDIFMIWTAGEHALREFIEFCNNFHETIKFTAEYNSDKIVFLDTYVHLDPITKKVYTSLYTKPTDTHSYLRYDSAHTRHSKNAGPYGQLLRVKRNCSRNEDYEREAQIMLGHYRKRGYPEQVLQDALKKSNEKNRADLLSPRVRKENKRPVLVLTYHPKLQGIQNTILRFWSIIENNHTLRESFPEKPLVAFRRNRTLKDDFVSSKLENEEETPTVFTYAETCMDDDCKNCRFINTETKFQSHTNKRCHSYRGPPVTCALQNVVYLISCQRCGKQYVGETKRHCISRTKEHRADIKHNRKTPVGIHFNKENHSINDFSVQVIEHINQTPDTSVQLRRKREHYWIYNLQTVQPIGLNLAEPN